MDAPNRTLPSTDPCHTIAEAAEATGTTIDMLRYYERAGVMPPVHRETVAAAIEELTDALAVLDRKIAHYEAAGQGVDLPCASEPLRHVSANQ